MKDKSQDLGINPCQRIAHEFQWHMESHGTSYWVCRICGEWKEPQYEDLGSGG